jgi:hypothetical protein
MKQPLNNVVLLNHSTILLKYYSRFQVTFQSAFPKFVLNIPNYITKFGILREKLQRQICMLVN